MDDRQAREFWPPLAAGTGLGTVLAWTVGASVASGLILVMLLRGKVE